MAEAVRPPAKLGASRFLARWDRELQGLHSPTLRYGLAVCSVAIALGLAVVLNKYDFRDVEVPVFTLAIAITTWYGGNGPAVLAVLLSSACFDYFFTEPLYSF